MTEYECIECQAIWRTGVGARRKPYFSNGIVSEGSGRELGICPTCTGEFVGDLLLRQPEIGELSNHHARAVIQGRMGLAQGYPLHTLHACESPSRWKQLCRLVMNDIALRRTIGAPSVADKIDQIVAEALRDTD